MEARKDIQGLDNKIRAAQASIASLSIFVALSAAMIGILAFQPSHEFGYNAWVVSSGSLMIAIVFFLLSAEYFILCLYYCDHIDLFGLIGSCAYGFGVICMIVGIALALKVFGLGVLPYVFVSLALLGYTAYYLLRLWKLRGQESAFAARIAIRIASLLLLIMGFVFLSTVGG